MSSTPDPFTRQRGLSGFGDDGQRTLSGASAVVVGVGGLGCPVAQYLAAAGIGRLTLIDADHVSVTNLHRQILFGPDDIGRLKVEAARDALARLAPGCTVTAVEDRIDSATASALLHGHDVVVDATDTMPVRRVIEDAAHALGLPVAWGAVLGWHGQVTVFDAAHRLDDVFPGPDAVDLDTCDGGAVWGPLCGQVGTAMASEAARLAAGLPGTLAGTLAIVDGRTGRWRDVALAPHDSGR
ncbi:HesA/MoeB/ThiF family protein [Demequina sp. NBRC 110055]|uniref:HesA/MoeB/ThiF family protein n=1 Tax=Demequina sp. NBRC 110055 TaxID=1570344 RepID=UPI0009FE04EC|nr:HesA/MoeB/ThiF family protein [Demequina sp. NBRC 110055]